MKSTSHFAMGHILYASLQKRNIHVNRVAFIYGNIAPDYLATMVVAPHFTKVCSRMINDISGKLSKTPLCPGRRADAEYSKQLGMLCHFLCDYFCFAHNKNFAGGLKQHSMYETELDTFFRHNCLELLDIDAEESPRPAGSHRELISDLEGKKEAYLSAGHTLKSDLCSSFNACIEVITSIFSLAEKLAPVKENFGAEANTSEKGYATGSCYTYKMFFFKNRNKDIFFLPELMRPIFA